MISSIILLLVQHFKYADEMPWPIWFRFMACALVECALYIVSLKKLDRWDLRTNYGRDRK